MTEDCYGAKRPIDVNIDNAITNALGRAVTFDVYWQARQATADFIHEVDGGHADLIGEELDSLMEDLTAAINLDETSTPG